MAAGKKLPLTNNVVLDQAAVLELIDQLRAAVPDEVRQAKRITEEAGRITDRAREEGDAVIARAQEQAAQMLEERELVRMAQQRAGEILDTANQEAAEVRRGADEYAAGVLIRLEGECIKALTSIKRGIDMLDERHQVPRPPTDGDRHRSAWSRRRPKPRPRHDRPQRRGPAPGGARSGSRGHACAIATSRWAPMSSWPGRSTARSASSAPTGASWCGARSSAAVRRTCARCLEAFVEPASIRISEEFLPSIDPETGAAVEHDRR